MVEASLKMDSGSALHGRVVLASPAARRTVTLQELFETRLAQPMANVQGSIVYKRNMAVEFAYRALREASRRAAS
jgi:CO/xanthine dehydrogenase FAD-binding subunit